MKIKVEITRQENADYFNKNIGDIVQVEFEEYIAAVVASEIGNAHIEACKAQAIAARSFAMSRSVLNDVAISDSSSTAQAYRAIRYDNKKYPKSIQGAQETAGMILCYNNKPAAAIYTASNGGRTVSSEERWGGKREYLIAQNDPWDAAVGKAKNGSGVGMSQEGAMYAAKQGFNYKQILEFYYPNTKLLGDYNMTKAEKLVSIIKSCMEYPYVFAALGQLCTPTNRKTAARDDYPEIINKCIALSGNSKCEFCKYNGQRMYDCRGFTYWCLNQVGITISKVGATTQWNTKTDWLIQGDIADMPNLVCCVFKKKDDKMNHTGFHIGNGQIIHCSSSGSGEVKNDTTNTKTWTHYAIPMGLYTLDEVQKAGRLKDMAVTSLKKGSSGAAVIDLQTKLNKLGFNCGTVDGVFGTKTETAVKNFQKKYNLNQDGVAGTATINKINTEYKKITSTTTTTPKLDTNTLTALKNIKTKLEEALTIINNLLK